MIITPLGIPNLRVEATLDLHTCTVVQGIESVSYLPSAGLSAPRTPST